MEEYPRNQPPEEGKTIPKKPFETNLRQSVGKGTVGLLWLAFVILLIVDPSPSDSLSVGFLILLLIVSFFLYAMIQIALGPVLWAWYRLQGKPSTWNLKETLTWILAIGVPAMMLMLVTPFLPHGRPKAKCSATQKNWTVATIEAATELKAVAQANAAGGNFDARDAIRNIIWRHCNIGSCVSLKPRYCDNMIWNEEHAPYYPDQPSMVEGIRNIQPESGQVALEMARDDPMAIIVYRDLSFEPVCGEPEPVRTTVRGRE